MARNGILIGDRIRKLMDANGITGSGTELATAMIERGIEIGTIESGARAINTHLSGKDKKYLQGEWIVRYCEFFNCSADYLLGLIEEQNHNVDSVSKITGLSDKAISTLNYLSNRPKEYWENDEIERDKKTLETIDIMISSSFKQTIGKKPKDDSNNSLKSIFSYIGDYFESDSIKVNNSNMVLFDTKDYGIGYDAGELFRQVVKKRIIEELDNLKKGDH